jgi:hypothetical protein
MAIDLIECYLGCKNGDHNIDFQDTAICSLKIEKKIKKVIIKLTPAVELNFITLASFFFVKLDKQFRGRLRIRKLRSDANLRL